MQKFMDFMGKLEVDNKCSGICTKEPIYYFSDINNGVPTTQCAEKIKSTYMIGKLKNFGIGLIIMALLLCLPWCLHFALYCLPGKASIL